MANQKHLGLVLKLDSTTYQGWCACGWTSSLTFFEEADLLKAMHIHEYAVFRSRQ